MENEIINTVKVEKESIAEMKFSDEEVLKKKDEIKIRTFNLDRAVKLGNIEHNKIKIVFESLLGVMEVETTVWAVTDKRVVLKKGINIPIHCIYSIV